MRAAMVWRATALATSPAACPPIPSATAKTWATARTLSSLPGRTRPGSVAVPQRSSAISRPDRRAGSRRLQDGVAHLDLVARPQHGRPGQASTVDVGAVGRPQIFDEDAVVPAEHPGVERRRERVVGDGHVAAGGAPDRELGDVELEAHALAAGWPGHGQAVRHIRRAPSGPPRAAGPAGRGRARSDRAGALRLRSHGADLGPDRPQDAGEEEVQQREEAQLEEAEELFGHGWSRLRTP